MASGQTQLDLDVRGLHCEGCERSVERAVQRLDGVLAVRADHHAGRLVVDVLPARADAAAIRRRVVEAGFEVVG